MSDEVGGIRDHLANERTQLAWLRTSANVVVVGLAVARFGDGGEVSAASLVAGLLLVATGAVGVLYGTRRYRQVSAALHRGDASGVVATTGPSAAAFVLLAVVLVAAAVLLLGSG